MPSLEDDLLKNLLATFQAEAADHLEALNQTLLQLERMAHATDEASEKHRQDLTYNAFRAAHSLKGAARAVSLQDIEELAHGLESVLQGARDGKLALDPAVCDVLYEALDGIQQVLQGQTVALDVLHKRLADIMPGAITVTAPALGADGGAAGNGSASIASEIPAAPGDEMVRVAVTKLDDLMAQVGELLLSKSSAQQRLTDMQGIQRQLQRWPKTWRDVKTLLARVSGETGRELTDLLIQHDEDWQTLSRDILDLNQAMNRDTSRLGLLTSRLQDSVRRVRMVPFQSLVFGLQRAVRDVARSEGKQIVLHVEGTDVELDKKVLEMLKDPLLHLLRNAVSHGIESPELRANLGKPVEGKVVLSVQQRGGEARVTVSDDGRGFDLEGLRRASAHSGGPSLGENARPAEIISLAFLPGVTTAPQVTAISGRGVGLDVVRRCLEAIQGRVLVDSVPGKGTTIQLLVPTSVTMTRGLLVRIGTEQYMLPLLSIEKILAVDPAAVFTVEGQSMITIEDKPLPLTSLAAALGRLQARQVERSLAVIISVAEQRLALLVDDVLTEQELAVTPIGRPLVRVRNVTGAALLGDGRPVVILNVADLVKSARAAKMRTLSAQQPASREAKPPTRILVVDDSITTRTLEKNILETAGYEVLTATDGLGALQQLRDHSVEVVVADIQMPEMDGIELTRHLRESADYSTLPVILVTSLGSREDRERGMMAGANAYIIKRGFDQAELLATIENFL